MKKICVTAYPYATQTGSIPVPESVDSFEELRAYILEHFDEIDFGEPELDYAGTDIEFGFNGREYRV